MDPQIRIDHEKYQMELSDWDRYVIWQYTLGSAVINNYLFGNDVDACKWGSRMFDLYNTNLSDEPPYLSEYFKNPKLYKASKDKVSILRELIKKVIEDLQRIIKQSPPLKRKLIVYKASSSYPGLYLGNNVKQQGFNSTSFRGDTDFIPFLKEDHCCFHQITIPRGSNVLILSPVISAYPDENEVILPYGISLHIWGLGAVELNDPVTNEERYKKIQREPIKIGNVYAYNHETQCAKKQKRLVKLYKSTLN